MPKTLRSAVAAVMILSSAALAAPVGAITLAAPRLPVGATAPQLTPVAVICGVSGCAPVRVSRVHRPPANFAKRAVPMTVTITNPPLSAASNK